MTFNPMVSIDSIDTDSTQSNDPEIVINELYRIIDKVKTGEYDSISGDLVGFKNSDAKVDIVSVTLYNNDLYQERNSSLIHEQLKCGSVPVALITHDVLLDSMRVIVEPIHEEDETVGYAITKGYEEFALTLLTIGIKEEVEV